MSRKSELADRIVCSGRGRAPRRGAAAAGEPRQSGSATPSNGASGGASRPVQRQSYPLLKSWKSGPLPSVKTSAGESRDGRADWTSQSSSSTARGPGERRGHRHEALSDRRSGEEESAASRCSSPTGRAAQPIVSAAKTWPLARSHFRAMWARRTGSDAMAGAGSVATTRRAVGRERGQPSNAPPSSAEPRNRPRQSQDGYRSPDE